MEVCAGLCWSVLVCAGLCQSVSFSCTPHQPLKVTTKEAVYVVTLRGNG